jgi:Uma2 family endonuclease
VTLQAKLTYQDYLDRPETKARYNIIDGELIIAGSFTRSHQTISGNVYRPVRQFVSERQLGGVWFAPLDVIVRQEPLRVRQPDLLFVSNENSGILGDRIEGGPDLVVEILSPSNTRVDIKSKLADYAQISVRECWIVSPQARTVEAIGLESGQYSRLFLSGLGDTVESEILSGFHLPVSQIFQGA